MILRNEADIELFSSITRLKASTEKALHLYSTLIDRGPGRGPEITDRRETLGRHSPEAQLG